MINIKPIVRRLFWLHESNGEYEMWTTNGYCVGWIMENRAYSWLGSFELPDNFEDYIW